MKKAFTRAIVTTDMGENTLEVEWNDGQRDQFHYIWLRDNDPAIRSQNGQISHDPFQLSLDIFPTSVVKTLEGLIVQWNDGHGPSLYSYSWLAQHSYSPEAVAKRRPKRRPWNVAEMESLFRKHDYRSVLASDEALREFLQDIWDFGFGVMQGVPDESGTVLKVAGLFGFPRQTNYGVMYELLGKHESEDRGNDTAYLPSHVDNTYRDPIPTVQLLHFMNNSVPGGESTVVDGIRIAEEIRSTDRRLFDLLTNVPVRYRYVDDDVDLAHEGPIIRTNHRNEIVGVLASPINVQPFDCVPGEMLDFYKAYHLFGRTMESPLYRFKTKMRDGDLMVTDNTRVLHGRTAFQPSGVRRGQGGYADYDALWSKLTKLGGRAVSYYL